MEKIENPKVFISYAWSTDDYKEKVRSFASELLANGIDVVLDQWSLKEGFDANAFMESSVNDPTITNVLILLDPVYAKKADARRGGVGTETQIISPEIYANTTQEKFIPIVFERDEDGDVHKPSFLNGRIHFDLTDEEKYNSEFTRLVKRLYGREAVKKPELGSRPAWVDEDNPVQTKVRVSYEVLKGNNPEKVKRERFSSFLRDIKTSIIEYHDDMHINDYLYHYEKMQPIRDQFLLLLKYYAYVDLSDRLIPDFFEETKFEIYNNCPPYHELKEMLLGEMFLYYVSHLYTSKDYDGLAELFTKAYYVGNSYRYEETSFETFRVYNDGFDRAVRNRDGKKYISGVAAWWIEHINSDFCSKSDFVFADILCFNASIIAETTSLDYWFPLTYIYDDSEHDSTRRFANRLHSKTNLNEICKLFGYSTGEMLIKRFTELESSNVNGRVSGFSYSGRFDSAPYIGAYIKAGELGTKR